MGEADGVGWRAQERWQLTLCCVQRARSRPKLALHDITHVWLHLTCKPPSTLQHHWGQGLCPSSRDSSARGQPQGGYSASAFQALVLPSLPAQAGGAHCKSSHRNQSRGGLARQAGEAPASGRNKHESTQLHKSLCAGKGGVNCFKKQEIPHENESWCSVTREGYTRTTASAELSSSACLVEWN